jgi:hypothetical protein
VRSTTSREGGEQVRKKRVNVMGAVVALAIIGGALLSSQCAVSPADKIDGPGMLYFYAVW